MAVTANNVPSSEVSRQILSYTGTQEHTQALCLPVCSVCVQYLCLLFANAYNESVKKVAISEAPL